MLMLGNSFVYGVVTTYTVYRYNVVRNENLGELTITQINWNILYNILTIFTIHAASALKRKVSGTLIHAHTHTQTVPKLFFFLVKKGKEAAIISHRIMNKCINKDIVSTVNKNYFDNTLHQIGILTLSEFFT